MLLEGEAKAQREKHRSRLGLLVTHEAATKDRRSSEREYRHAPELGEGCLAASWPVRRTRVLELAEGGQQAGAVRLALAVLHAQAELHAEPVALQQQEAQVGAESRQGRQ